MQELRAYWVEVRGLVDGNELNALSPYEMELMRAGSESSLLGIRTDQSGLIGLLRHLHGRGFVLLSMVREPERSQ